MKLGVVGLGRMGSNMVRRLLGAGHECVVFDVNPRVESTLDELALLLAADDTNKLLSAMRYQFGGHEEKHP